MEWKEYQIQDVCRLINGRAYSNDEMLEHGKYKIVRVGNLSGGNSTWFYSDLELPADKYCHNGDLLFAWACTFGPHIWKEDNTIFHYHIWKIVEDKDVVDRRFFYYYLKFATGGFLGALNGSVMVHITKSSMEKMIIRIPKKLDDQRRIASILSSLDRKIEMNNKINADLEEMAQAIFKNWFVDFEPFKDGKFVDSELGMIPEGWKVGGIFDIAEIFDKKRKPLSGNVREKMDKIYPYYGATSCMDYVDDYIFDGIYTLIGEDGSVVKENGLPYMQYVWGKMWVNNHAHILQGKNGYSTEMIHALLSITNIKFLVTGAVQAKLSQGNMQKILVAIPPMNVLDEIRPVIDNLYSKIRINTDENSRLSLLRDTLLPRLMSGELEVPE